MVEQVGDVGEGVVDALAGGARVGGAVGGGAGLGEAVEDRLPLRAAFGGEVAGEVVGAVAVAGQPTVAAALVVGVVGEGAVGVVVVVDAGGGDREPGRVEGVGVVDQGGLDGPVMLGLDRGGEVVDRVDDHPGVVDRDRPAACAAAVASKIGGSTSPVRLRRGPRSAAAFTLALA